MSGIIFKQKIDDSKVITFTYYPYNLVADMLAIFITRAKEYGQTQGLIPI